MCGIFACISNEKSTDYESSDNIRLRGPDNTVYEHVSEKVLFGFHRLKINDLSDEGNQPFSHNGIYLICNGEIYNSDDLRSEFTYSWKSKSDCEVLIHVYEKHGFEKMCSMIDGVFAIVLYDSNTKSIWLGRDPFGVRPMFYGSNTNMIHIASELKGVNSKLSTIQFPPGSYMKINESDFSNFHLGKYFDLNTNFGSCDLPIEHYCKIVKARLIGSVKKRLMSDRPIGCLLSGGLDSSLVCSIVANEFRKNGKGTLNTFSIGFKGSTDLVYARKVAEHIGSKHHEIVLTENEFLSAIDSVIRVIESYDTTTVRASVGNYLVSKYIRENTDITVVFNGDGSDEVAGGYLYLKNAPDNKSFHKECIKLLNEIHYFDVLRSDRALSSNWSLESRTPFLDKTFVKEYLSVPIKYRVQSKENKIEKYLLRKAFENENYIPDEVLWRTKEAFSDGVSSADNSWHKVIQKYIDNIVPDEEFQKEKEKYEWNKPILKESYYYRKVFESIYPQKGYIIPHFWMPKWSNTNDPSARELTKSIST
jgi:asparagine synthase (glutamine-hydrolysing)